MTPQENGSPKSTPTKKTLMTRIKALFSRSKKQSGPKKEKTAKKQKKPPEKRLFHKPITAGKIIQYVLLATALAAVIITLRFVYLTVINPHAAFDNTPPAATVAAEPTETPGETDPDTTPQPTPTLSPRERLAQQADLDFMKDRVNVLMTGIDYAEERKGRTDFRTDTIMLLSVNFKTGEVDILSVPRDSYADIAGTKRKWKINGAYMSAGGADGDGFNCLMETVSNTIGGIPVDYYIGVEMQAVKDIVDVIGGVWYDVDYEIYMNNRHLEKGYQLLDGQAVLDYCRARKGITSGTDIDRIDRQQRLLMEVFNQMKSGAQLQKIPEMYTTLQDEIYTNLNLSQITALALFALDLDLDTEMNRYTLKGEYMKAYSATYYVLDHNVTVDIIQEIFGQDVSDFIDWNYSISHVRNDVARSGLSSAIASLSALVSDNHSVLTSAQISAANKLLDQAAATLRAGKTDAMNAMASKLNAKRAELYAYIKNPPTPTPTDPTPTPTDPTPTPTNPTTTPTNPTTTPTDPTPTPTPTNPTTNPTTTPTATTDPTPSST